MGNFISLSRLKSYSTLPSQQHQFINYQSSWNKHKIKQQICEKITKDKLI